MYYNSREPSLLIGKLFDDCFIACLAKVFYLELFFHQFDTKIVPTQGIFGVKEYRRNSVVLFLS